ncbi:MAG TPA: sigma-70 family RNA polymerase sigma factor [Ktedonobacterales bacterium]|nr:sigma-70 family RNA polymerase sigma factor [Ktedonobacterales bacterium]
MQDERLLLAQIATGDEEALRQLYLAYRPRLRRYLWHQLAGDNASVEDALQEVFLAVWRTAGGYRGEARVSTWLYQITRYVALGVRRRQARQPDALPLDLDEDNDRFPYGPHDAQDWSAANNSCERRALDRVALRDALARLSPRHREALMLVFQHGFSPQEVAQILDVPAGTVKSRISYARKALMRALDLTLTEEARHDA